MFIILDLQNNGNKAWPKNTRLRCIEGDNFSNDSFSINPLNIVHIYFLLYKGESEPFHFSLLTPKHEGVF